jgi:outer membrane protein
MKRVIALAVSLISGLVLSAAAQTLTASAETDASAAPAKVAIIAFQMAVAQANEGQRSIGDLKQKFDPKRQQLKARSAELDALAKQLQSQSGTLSEAEFAKRRKDIAEKRRVFDRDAQDAQNDLQTEMQEIYKTLSPKVYEVLVSYAKQQGYTLVLDISLEQNPVLYASDSTNITKAVLEAYNAKSGVPAPPSSLPAGPAAGAPATH